MVNEHAKSTARGTVPATLRQVSILGHFAIEDGRFKGRRVNSMTTPPKTTVDWTNLEVCVECSGRTPGCAQFEHQAA